MKLSQVTVAPSSARRLRGFTLVEILIALTLAAAAIGLALHYQSRATELKTANDFVKAIDRMVNVVRNTWGAPPARSYLSVQMINIFRVGGLSPPIKWDSGNAYDPWGNRLNIAGYGGGFDVQPQFIVYIGDTSRPMDTEVCVTIASQLALGAEEVRLGTPATMSPLFGFFAGGTVYKSRTVTPDPSMLASLCAVSGANIGLRYL